MLTPSPRSQRFTMLGFLVALAVFALPTPAFGFCQDDSDCPWPKTCRNGLCADPSLPYCADVCNITTACSTPCLLGSQNRTCGQFGNCYLAPCASLCNASSDCKFPCEMDGVRSTCSYHGQCYTGAVPGCSFDRCEQGSCRKPSIGTDGDVDGVPDRLEYELAHRFFPSILLQTANDDLLQTYTNNTDLRTLPYRVHAITSPTLCAEAFKCLEIRYGTAYFNDTGDPTWGGGHSGDSEFYAAVLLRTTSWGQASANAADWQMVRDFTAAHWGELTDSSVLGQYGYCPPSCSSMNSNEAACSANPRCSWFPGFCHGGLDGSYSPCSSHWGDEDCESSGGSCFWLSEACLSGGTCYQGSPATSHRTLYSAEGKHALYHSDAECDDGNWIPGLGSIDECKYNAYNWRAYVTGRLQNVGEGFASEPFDHWIQHPDKCRLYDVWGDAKFANSSRYKEKFGNVFGWDLP